MGFFKKLFGGKSESEKAKEKVNELTNELSKRYAEIILEKKANLEKSQTQASNSQADDNMVMIPTNDKSIIPIEICLEDKDQEEFSELIFRASLRGEPYIYYPRDKWEKAVEEHEKEKRKEQMMYTSASLNNKGIEQEKEGDIQNAILTYEENIRLFEEAGEFGFLTKHPYDRLIILYHKLKDSENEKRILNKATVLYPDDTRYQKKLAILSGSFETKVITSAPRDIQPSGNWGEIWEERILEVPEFDFYSEQETNPNKYVHDPLEIGKVLKPIWEVQGHFKTIESKAKAAEDRGEQEEAVRLYEQMVADRYYMPSPYDRLIKIYSMAKLHDEEIRILKIGIDHFKQLREKRKAYTIHLAKKYNALDFALERINGGKKITYYNGVFEIYNPFPIVERWEARLQKLQSKKNK